MATVNPSGGDQITRVVRLPDYVVANPIAFFGPADQVIRTVERAFAQVQLVPSEREILVRGPLASANIVFELLQELASVAAEGVPLTSQLVEEAIALLGQSDNVPTRPPVAVQGKVVRAKTPGQQLYLDALRDYPVVFGIGPAGTGKTYLAMAEAVAALLRGDVKRIVLTRPAVEAGENLGFLPGSASEKIDPYLRPLFDALRDLLDEETLGRFMAAGAIEIAPLAYMRGRTLNDSYIILDEAQNTTSAQMKMFLTRLGFRSHMVVTGDDSQIDLPHHQISGLRVVQQILPEVPEVSFIYLTSADVVRNPLVSQIVEAYARWETKMEKSSPGGRKEGNR